MPAPPSDSPAPDTPLRARRAVVLLDAVDSTALLASAEGQAVAQWLALIEHLRQPWLAQGGGRLVKSTGDGMLIEFSDVRHALRAVVQIHDWVQRAPERFPDGRRLALRAGVHVAEVLVHDIDLFGLGVHLAARLAALAGPGGTVVSEPARDECADDVDGHFVDLGERYAKGLAAPLRCFRFLPPGSAGLADPPPLAPGDLRPVIAVVPLRVDVSAGEADSLGYAIADDLIGGLSRCAQLTVLSRLSTAALRGLEATPDQMRLCTGAAYALCGRVRVDQGRVRVEMQLSETRGGRVLWSTQGTATVDDILHGQAAVVRQALQEVARCVIRTEIDAAGRLPLSSLAGYTLYVGGSALMHRRSRHDFERAHGLLEALTARHPRCAAAHALLAKWHVLALVQGWSADAEADGRLARERAATALDLDPEHAFALSIDALVAAHFEADLGHAWTVSEAAVEADPQEAHAWLVRAGIAAYRGQAPLAEQAVARAIELSPTDPARFAFDVFAAFCALSGGRLEEAVDWARASIRRHATHAPAHRTQTIALALLGRMDEARAAGRELLRVDPGFTVDGFARRYPGRDQAHAPQHFQALRAAGLPP